MRCWVNPGITLLVLLAATTASGQDQSTPAEMMERAASLEAASEYAVAAPLYVDAAARLEEPSKRIQANLGAGRCFEAAGKPAQALAGWDAAIRAGASGDVLAVALFGKGQACVETGDAAAARNCIERLNREFPETSASVRAGILLARLQGQGTAAAEAAYAAELAASSICEQAQPLVNRREDEAAMALLDKVVTEHAGTAAAMRACDTMGHLLIRNGRKQDAGIFFVTVLDRLGEGAPNSRLVQRAKLRLGALYYRFRQSDDCLRMYQELLSSPDRSISSRAALQVSGLSFERLQRKRSARQEVTAEEWQQLRDLFRGVMSSGDASSGEKIRAELMLVESLSWEGKHEEALSAAEAFLAKCAKAQFRVEAVTAHFFAGESAQAVKQYERALSHYRSVIDDYGGQAEIWPSVNYLPRTYLNIWQTLILMNAPMEEIKAARDALCTAAPESSLTQYATAHTQQLELWGTWKTQQ